MRHLGKLSYLFVIGISVACGNGGAHFSVAPPPSPPPGLGSVSSVSSLSACPADFYPGITCFKATVSCASTDDVSVIYGYKTPAAVKGTIFLHPGSGCTTAVSYGPSVDGSGDSSSHGSFPS